ncbi:MAG: D-glycerate dehydrogenase [Ignavibacteriaceae bacterium]|jgi:glyoxylate reductase
MIQKSKFKVFITREIPNAAIKLLKDKGYNVRVYSKDSPIPVKELYKNIKDADAVISLLNEKFDVAVLDKMEKCKIIANYAVGYNNIDIEYAKKKNIIITNTPDVLTDSTADLAMALVLACARKIIEAEKYVHTGEFKGWKPKLFLGIEIKDKMFGILGGGRIGTAVAIRAKAFGAKIIYLSRRKNQYLEDSTGAKKVSLDTLLKTSDFISIHLPLTYITYHLLNKEKLSLMKKTSVLINTARGEIVDEKILIRILKQKKICCAGFDVFENEPNINPELLELGNVVALPHIGSATVEARTKMALLAAENIISVLSGKGAITPVL